MPTFWRVFIINGCWILLKAVSACIEIIVWFFTFNLLIWCITLIDLCILKNPCIPGINPTWSWCMVLLMCCWILFPSILLRIFASMFNKDLALTYLSCSIFVWLWYQGDAGLMSLELIPLLLFFERMGVEFCQKLFLPLLRWSYGFYSSVY